MTKISDLKDGDTIILDDGFTCAPAGPTVVRGEGVNMWFPRCGDPDEAPDKNVLNRKHFLVGQEECDGELIGVSLP